MAITILPEEETLASRLGTALGTGITGGIEGLVSGKLKQMQAQQFEQAGLPGILAHLEPHVQASYLKQLGAAQQMAQQQGLANFAEEAASNNMLPEEAAQAVGPVSAIPEGPEEVFPSTIPKRQPESESREDRLQQEIDRLVAREADSGLTSDQRRAVKSARESREDKLATLRKERFAASKDIMKLSKDDIKEIRNKASAATQQKRDLERLIEIEKDNKLDSATYDAFLKNSGLDIAALRSPESQEFNKIVNNFVRDIKSIFGARISNQEMEQFMKTLPSLSQSPEGRKRVVSNLMRIARENEKRGKILNKILRDNKGALPADWQVQIEDRMGPRLDKIAKAFKKDLARSVPEAESALKVGAGAVAGRALPIAAGAGLGAMAGPAGALLGAGAGAAFPSIINILSRLGG